MIYLKKLSFIIETYTYIFILCVCVNEAIIYMSRKSGS